jgi:hypothetical protein
MGHLSQYMAFQLLKSVALSLRMVEGNKVAVSLCLARLKLTYMIHSS